MPQISSFQTAITAALVLLLGSCSSAPDYTEAPRNQSDLCAIFDQRPGWQDAVIASESRWGAPAPVQMAIMWRESSFRSSVRPPKKYTLGMIPNGHISSAYGYAQAIDGTWDWYREETGNSGADRTDFEDAVDFIGWYMAKSRASNGIGMHDAYNQYLAYHEGHAGHRRGSYNAKPWLINVANKVAVRAARYRGQISGC